MACKKQYFAFISVLTAPISCCGIHLAMHAMLGCAQLTVSHLNKAAINSSKLYLPAALHCSPAHHRPRCRTSHTYPAQNDTAQHAWLAVPTHTPLIRCCTNSHPRNCLLATGGAS
jgi:hypothetical protein